MKKYFVLLTLLLLCGLYPARTLAQGLSFTGSFEVADCNSISGWAEDANNLNTAVHVNIFSGSTIVATVLANGPRNDVGPHGFSIRPPLALLDGQVHSISARVESSNNDILNSPRSIGPCEVAAFVIPNPKITSFEIRVPTSGSRVEIGTFSFDATTNPNLSLQVEIDHPDRVHFFRLAEISDQSGVDHPEQALKTVSWQPYTQGMTFTLKLETNKPYGTRYVFMQVNTSQNESSASAAKGDSIVFAPAHLKTFTLSGQALRDFIDRAKAVGYKFTTTAHSLTLAANVSDPCPRGTVIDTSQLKPVSGPAELLETTSVKIFDRNERFLNPFWKMTNISIPGNGAQVTISGPSSGRADDPFRTVGFKAGFTFAVGGGLNHDVASNFSCVIPDETTIPGPFNTGKITSITLEGPDDKQPRDAFFDLNFPTFQLKPIQVRPSIPRP